MRNNSTKICIGSEIINARAVAFDKDGTLFDSIQFWSHIDDIRKREFLNIVGAEFGNDWSTMMGFQQPDRVDHTGVLAVATTAEEILLTAGLIYRCRGWTWYECKKKAHEIFANADRQLILEKAFQAKENVPEVFHELHSCGIYTGIMTSDGGSRTSALMRMLKIDDLLEFVITPESVSKGKPDPEMIHAACDMLKIKPEDLVVVGDSVVDVKMAKSAGSIGVGLITYEGSEKDLSVDADILIHSISEIRVCNDI